MNNQSKNKLKATHIDCKIPAHDMIDVCNFDLKVTLLPLGRQLADLLYQLKDDCSHISCFSWLVVCCPGGGSSIRTRSASMDDAEGVALTHDSTSLFFTTLMALTAQRCCSLEAETWTLDFVGWFKMWLPGSSETRHVLAWACRPFTEADLKELMEDFQFEMGVFFFFDSVHLPRKAPCLSFLWATWTRGQTAELQSIEGFLLQALLYFPALSAVRWNMWLSHRTQAGPILAQNFAGFCRKLWVLNSADWWVFGIEIYKQVG